MKATSRIVLLTLLCILMTAALPLVAITPPALMVTDGTSTATIDQGGNVIFSNGCVNCSTTSVSVQPGTVSWDGSLGGFRVISVTGLSKPVLAGAPNLDIRAKVFASTGGNLTIQWTDANYPEPQIVNVELGAGGTISGGGSVSVSGYTDNTNTPFGTGVFAGTLGPFTTSSFSGGLFGPGPTQAPFSMTESVSFNLGANGTAGGDFSMQALPAPLSLNCPASTGQVNVPYSSSLHANGGVPPYTFSIISGMLPDGLTLDSSTGAIAGTPTSASTFTFTGQVQDSSGLSGQDTVQQGCTIIIQPPTQLYEISGYTYADNNQNMIYDHPPDTPIGGVTITLTDCSSNVLATTVTDGSGFYQFTGLPAGCYHTTAPPTANNLNLETAPILTENLGPNSDNNNFGYILPVTCQAVDTGTVGVAFDSGPMTISGGTPPYTFSIVGTLPPGLTLNSSNGEITGIPTALGSFSVQVKDSTGATSTSCNITINPNVSASCVVINAVQGFPITPVTLVGSGGYSPYTFTSSDLTSQTGLTISPDGTISGTPTVSGMFTYHVTVTDSKGNSGIISCGVTIAPPPSAACLVITNAVQGQFLQTGPMTGSGGSGAPYTFSATGLPPGLTMASDGSISGTPTQSGTFTYTVTVADSQGHTGTIQCSVTVAPQEGVSCVAINAVQGIPIMPVTLTASGGYPPYTFSASGLPAGLTISSNGTISGTPTVNGTFPYTVTVTDSHNNTSKAHCSVLVQPTPPVSANCVVINAVAGVPITPVTMMGSGGVGGPYTFSATGLPPGLTMSSNGTISGTPTQSGTFSYTVTITDSANNKGTISCSVTVQPSGNACKIGPSSMEGTLTNILPGDWISGGYSFTIPGSHPQQTVTVSNITVTIPVTCPKGGGAGGSIVIPLPNASYVDGVNNNNWIPTGDANSVLSWEGSIQAPDLCSGLPMANQSGAIFNSTTSTQGGASFRFKYRDPQAKGKGNVNCADPNWQPPAQRNDAATCGASWSSTKVCQ